MRSVKYPVAGILVATLFVVASAAAGSLDPNPANDKRLVNKPIESFRYDNADHCRSKPPRGMRALAKWLDRSVRGVSWGIMRCERLGSGHSLHSEGRAIDWHLDARRTKEKRAAMRLIRTRTTSTWS